MDKKTKIISMDVNVTNLHEASQTISGWAYNHESRYVCVSNVHMCVEAYDDIKFQKTVNNADMVVPDGRPIFWAQRLLKEKNSQQVRGEDLTVRLCRLAEQKGLNVGFYGGKPETLEKLQRKLTNKFPNLNITSSISPPFRQLTSQETERDIRLINESSTQILFVGLGCPKQERWMQSHKGEVNTVMLGVGAAFDFIAGNKKHAPLWMQKSGLEWLHRLLSEPNRLWKRYLYTNPKFILLLIWQLL